jgi:hypothetical protein
MLINLSNHPYLTSWLPEQIAAAKAQFEKVEDMDFPNVPPDADTEGVNHLAHFYAEKITKKYRNQTITVHLMGEMTFVVALLRLLQKAQIRVICSTTKRLVLEENQGKKTMQFQFVQFREYPNIS